MFATSTEPMININQGLNTRKNNGMISARENNTSSFFFLFHIVETFSPSAVRAVKQNRHGRQKSEAAERELDLELERTNERE